MAFVVSPTRRRASPSRNRCEVSLGSARASCSSTSAAFPSLPFLRSSTAESLSLRVSRESLAMSDPGFYRAFQSGASNDRGVRAAHVLATNVDLPAAPCRGGRPVSVPACGERRGPRRTRLCLPHLLVAKPLHVGAPQLAQLAGPHPLDRNPSVVGA